MKKLLLSFLLWGAIVHAQEIPFSRGVNLSGWLQTNNSHQIQFNKYGKQDFLNIKSLGCDVIRLPFRLNDMTLGAPDYELDPLFLYFLDQIVEWAEEVDIHLILDNHTFDVESSTSPDIDEILVPVWRNLAAHYSDGYNKLYYEILNEPHGISDELWGTIQGEVINAIREVDTLHHIVVGPAGWNSYHNLQYMPEYEDDKLIYTFHFYEPFIFTHQGASWPEPSLESLTGVPFPYDASAMPSCPPDLLGTYVESTIANYSSQGSLLYLTQQALVAAQFANARNVPIFCGEFGVYIPDSPNDDRVYWYKKVRELFENYNIAWTTWDYQGGFGLFEKNTFEMFNYDLNLPLIEALGLTQPEQFEFSIKPDSTNIYLYHDYFGEGVSISNYGIEGFDFYEDSSPAKGNFSILWNGGEQYSSLRMDFVPDKDLTVLKNSGYLLDLLIKGDTPSAKLDIRFLDTKTDDPNDHPWRMGVTITEFDVPWNNEWQRLTIPLTDMVEKGSWDNNQWYEPEGKFDWTSVNYIEIVAEHHAVNGMTFGFDEIRIVDQNSLSVGNSQKKPSTFSLAQNYPNPFNPGTVITFSIGDEGTYDLILYNILGEKVVMLKSEISGIGEHKFYFDASGYTLSGGIYFYSLEGNGQRIVKKMSYLK